MKYLFFNLLFLVFSFNARSEESTIYRYDYWVPQWITEYQSQLLSYHSDVVQPLSTDGNPTCKAIVQKSFDRGHIDIRYVFGYFDDSATGDLVQWEGVQYGRSPSLDIATFEGFRKSLMAPCQGDLLACGFKQSSSSNGVVELEKKVKLYGQTIPVKLTLAHSSVTQNYILNTTEFKAQQSQFSAQAESVFLSGIREADIVFYNGHSRNGGGPDFNPPILRDSDHHPNYDGYYKVKRPGIKKVLEALKGNTNPGLVFGLFSCSSYNHFYTMLTKAAPTTRLILSTDLVDYHESLITSIGYLNGLLQGRCGEDLAQYAKRTPKLYDNFKGYRIR